MQKEIIGANSINKVGEIVNDYSAKKILLVTGGESFYKSGAKKKLNELLVKTKLFVFNKFSKNPKLDDVEKGICVYKDVEPDLIIAVGGGSVIDMAKLINILAVNNFSESKSIIKNPNLINKKGIPLIAIPTTSGSGSQATQFAVVYIENKKYSVSHRFILPDFAIVDSNLSASHTGQGFSSSVIDALSQSVESIWSNNSTLESKEYASESVKLILDYSSKAINIKNKKALQSISAAAHLSGKSINITKTTAPHAISYILTSNFNIAHGHAVGIMVAPIAYISYLKNDSNFNKSLQVIYELFDCDSIYGFIEKWKKIMTHFGLAYKLEDLGVVKNDVDMIVSNINIERLNNHPVNLTNKDLIKAINISISGFINHV